MEEVTKLSILLSDGAVPRVKTEAHFDVISQVFRTLSRHHCHPILYLRNHLLERHCFITRQHSRRSISLKNICSVPWTPMWRRFYRNSLSLMVLFPSSLEELNISLAHPFLCVLSLARGNIHVLRGGQSRSLSLFLEPNTFYHSNPVDWSL